MVAKTAETEARLQEELSKERKRGEDLENRLEELHLVTNTVRPMGIGTPGSVSSNSFFLLPVSLSNFKRADEATLISMATMSKSMKNSSPRRRLADLNQPLLNF